MAACEKVSIAVDTRDASQSKVFTFALKGDFDNAFYGGETRGYMQANGQDLTDLWVFDYVDGSCVQSLHQTPEDEYWGKPSLPLAYGSHHIYFVASRGADYTVDNEAGTITWGRVSDTFWTDYSVQVVSTSNGNRAVTLDRVATKLKITVTDEVPSGISSVAITPSVWYYGIDYITGEAVEAQSNISRTISVPSSYVGTSGTLSMIIFGISPSTEWSADVSIAAKDGENATIGQASIRESWFMRNRSTEYSGPLFGSNGTMVISVNDTWDDPATGTW